MLILLTPPKPLLIPSRDSSPRSIVLPETMAVKLEEEKEDTVADVNPPATINTEICFGNLPYNFDSARLAQIIQDFANAELVKSRGFAFLTMSNVVDCNVIIENLDGTASEKKPKPNKEPLYLETEYKLFVGKLSWTVITYSSLLNGYNYLSCL
ncbi:hypothetical protein HID58_086639, partial [Brassica napus]